MPITERDIAGGWERVYTGEDIQKAAGALTRTGNEAYQEAFHKDEKAHSGHGLTTRKIMTSVPALPWQADRLPGEKWSEYQKRKAEAV